MATLVGGERIVHTHNPALCAGKPCAVHNPSDHHMKNWPQHFRDPFHEAATFGLHPGLMERICPHGIGHPDPDHMTWYASCHTSGETYAEGVHGCDGCCEPPQFTVGDLRDALEHAVALARNTTSGNMEDAACVDWALRRARRKKDV